MGSLPVTGLDRLLLGTQQPVLVSRALHRIFYGSAFRFSEAGIVLLFGLAIAWIVVASLGRAVTLAALLEESGRASESGRATTRSLFALNFLRIAVALAAVVAGVGAALIANSFWAATKVSFADATRLWFVVLCLVWVVWAFLNWLLSAAAVFVVTDRKGSLNAIASCARFSGKHPGPVLAAGVWFGLAHLGALIVAYLAGFTALSTVGAWRIGPALALEFLIVLGYCGVADFLYAGRLAAYVAMVHGQELERSGLTAPITPASGLSSVDRDELILSDVPLRAT